MIQTSLFSISVFFSGSSILFLPVYFATDASLCRDSIGFWAWKNGAYFWKRHFLVWLVKTLCFIAGLSTVFLILGYGAGALGQVLYAPWFRYLLGGIVILLGIHQMGLINLHQLQKQKSIQLKKDEKRNEFFNAFLIGVTFSLVGPLVSDQFWVRF